MRRDQAAPHGEIHETMLVSHVLRENLVGLSARRRIDIYLPPNHDGKGLPLLVDLVGFTAGGPAHTNWKNFSENVPERLDRLIGSGAMAPCVVAFPDCFTRLGGNQYVNSTAMGRWDNFLREECVPFVEKTYGCGGAGKRGVFGKSSGGYGAMVHALLHPDFWSAAASHSGDMGFPLMYGHEFVPVLRALAKNGGDIGKWVDDFWAAPKTKDSDVGIIMMLAQAASFDPDPSAPYGVRLPVTLDTCEFIAERWNNWLAWDPLTLTETRGAGMKAMKGLYIDCGDIDQYNLVYGARRMHRELDRLGVTHTYEEFPDNHSSVDYRMDVSLPFLAKVLSA
jgi:enterochelin esterase-like enzyme